MILSSDDKLMFSMALEGGYSLFTRYFFDWEPLKNQWVEHYAPQPNVVQLGGIGSGKTVGKALSFLTKALIWPWYTGLNTSISSFQSTLMFNFLLPHIEDNPKISRFIKDIRAKPYPKITTVFNSQLAFMTVGFQAQGIRGSEWDEINFDEGGYERAEETIVALRGRLRGTRPNGIERLARLTITTTPTDVPWLRVRFERGTEGSTMEEFDPTSYCSLRSTLYDNHHIPEWQRNEIIKDLPQEMILQEIEAEFPDWGLSEFPESHITACEDLYLNARMEQLINPIIVNADGTENMGTPAPGATYVEVPRVGVTYWEMPYDPSRVYVIASDPGTASPPRRNSPVVLAFDVTDKPYELVYFAWVSGNGSYIPWLKSFRYALDKYKPVLRGMDATGTQKAIDELVLEREGIEVDAVNFARDKLGMLNTLKMLLQNHELKFPFIKGIRTQLRSYQVKDDKISQDIVAALMVFAYVSRFIPNTVPSQVSNLQVRQASYDHRVARSNRSRAAHNLRRSRR